MAKRKMPKRATKRPKRPADAPKRGRGRPSKERLFSEHYLISGNATEAAVAAGYSPHSARQKGWELAKKVNGDLEVELRKAGIDERRVAERIAELINYKLVKWNPAEERFEAFEDGKLQLAALTKAAEYLGLAPNNASVNINAPGSQIQVISNIPRPKREAKPPVPDNVLEGEATTVN